VKGRSHVEEVRYTADWQLGSLGWEITKEVFVQLPRA